ncbi:enolase C-terminal domain-like protein [Saccharopolyspora shandongensis]|uniref:enolase C-terminal domain-like protein n=1 Tax=Saccharopolyspora shandongensis TaxID=418495 RepID=UPI0034167FF9
MTSGEPVRAVEASAYRVPTDRPEADGTLTWSDTTIVVVRVRAGEVVGLGWTYAHGACVELIRATLGPLVEGRDVLDVPACWDAMQRAIRNLGRPGLVSCAMSAVDTALWDASARLLGVPLCRLFGRVRESVPVYGSGGFTSYGDEELREQLQRWTTGRALPAVKIKVGESWGTMPRRDLDRVAFAREVIGDDVELYVDANGGYSVGQAARIGSFFDELDVRWFEEPVSSDDVAGLRFVRHAVAADVAAGEYGYRLADFAALLAGDSVDCLQVDVTRCGGYGEWRRVASFAAAHHREVSGHCAQNLAAHVAAATPNFRHLEWFHDHDRLERMFFDGVLDPAGGAVRPDLSAAGHGMSLKDADVQRYRVA